MMDKEQKLYWLQNTQTEDSVLFCVLEKNVLYKISNIFLKCYLMNCQLLQMFLLNVLMCFLVALLLWASVCEKDSEWRLTADINLTVNSSYLITYLKTNRTY